MKSLVSIIIPVYNGENYLRQSIQSALEQTYSPIEIIVINDGSDDNASTRNIALSFGEKIRYIEKQNGGVASALNIGIENMKGDYFSWLSHDDLYYPIKIEEQYSFIKKSKNKKIIVFSHEDLINAEGRLLHKAEPFELNGEPFAYRLIYSHFLGGCSLLIPRQAFIDAGVFNPALKTIQDYDLWFRMIAAGYKFTYCPIASGMSRQHDKQDSKSKVELCNKEKNWLFIKVQKDILPDRLFRGFSDKTKAIYKLVCEFEQQGLMEVALFDRTLLRKELSKKKFYKRIVIGGIIFSHDIQKYYLKNKSVILKKLKKLKRKITKFIKE